MFKILKKNVKKYLKGISQFGLILSQHKIRHKVKSTEHRQFLVRKKSELLDFFICIHANFYLSKQKQKQKKQLLTSL